MDAASLSDGVQTTSDKSESGNGLDLLLVISVWCDALGFQLRLACDTLHSFLIQ